MLKQLKTILNVYKNNKRLEEENQRLREDNLSKTFEVTCLRQMKTPDLKDVLKTVLGGKTEWFDYNELTPPNLITYYNEAQHILRTNIFNNEVSFLKANWGKRAILEAHSMDPERVAIHIQKMSWMLLGIEQFKERLEEIPNPQQPEKQKENTHSAV